VNSSLVELVCFLAALPGLPGQEDQIAAVVKQYFEERGIGGGQDRAGATGRGAVRNLRFVLPGRAGLPHLLFVAHLDVARTPGRPTLVEGLLQVKEGFFAADDRVGLALLLALVDKLPESSRRGTVELLLTVAEEAGMLGVRQITRSEVRADWAFVLDCPGPPGVLVNKADAGQEFVGEIMGNPLHTGPDALWVTSRALARLPVGCSAPGGNILEVSSSIARSGDVTITGAIYAANESGVREISELVKAVFAETSLKHGLDCSFRLGRAYPGYSLPVSTPAVALAVAAARHARLEPIFVHCRCASDANILNAMGIPAVNLGSAWHEGPDDAIWACPDELEQALDFLATLVSLAACEQPWQWSGGNA